MAGSSECRIIPSGKYERSLEKLLKQHYKKNRKGHQEFTEFLGGLVHALAINPRRPGTQPEPWPGTGAIAGMELRRAEFRMPRLQGSSALGRVVYLYDPTRDTIGLVWIYTHEEFKGRPPDREMTAVIKELTELFIKLIQEDDS